MWAKCTNDSLWCVLHILSNVCGSEVSSIEWFLSLYCLKKIMLTQFGIAVNAVTQ